MNQISFDPLDHNYDFGADLAHKAAQKARNAKAKELRAQGIKVHCWRLTGQLRKYASFGVEDGRVRTVYYVSILEEPS